MSTTTTRFVVLAEFNLKPGTLDAFLELANADARESLANEEHCYAFDVLIHEGNADTVVLHEVYRDRNAFEYHQTMPHYAPFKQGSAPLLAGEPSVRFFQGIIHPE
ncbi:putative quinol monooxygenase [Azomonas macrocytogenes]|uniref:Quinol monooxygenase YgiN n=1 Tax=Azomonas macrocytogenes TaxID=69962 RepID=A0A839T5I3_AZOMA|nr:putative quinol monooxygenase [Azomonas macrocytogenes]MBB3103195.1 quinol monooxygenase YgiN [Azomonas macrocytogenes]